MGKEVRSPGRLPLYYLEEWGARHGVVAGITGRGTEPGRGFDLGLWADTPAGEAMSRWQAFRQSFPGFTTFALGHQVHGARVAYLDGGEGWIQLDGVDGWVTVSPGIMLTVTVADCVPVYLLVPGRGIALLHAGWRGTAAGILPAGLTRLTQATGSAPADVVMHCGIGICGCCYEVGSEVMTSCGVVPVGDGPHHLDLRRRLAEEAEALGVRDPSISPWCSAHDHSLFFSHRASGGVDGRMVAFLGLPPTD